MIWIIGLGIPIAVLAFLLGWLKGFNEISHISGWGVGYDDGFDDGFDDGWEKHKEFTDARKEG